MADGIDVIEQLVKSMLIKFLLRPARNSVTPVYENAVHTKIETPPTAVSHLNEAPPPAAKNVNQVSPAVTFTPVVSDEDLPGLELIQNDDDEEEDDDDDGDFVDYSKDQATAKCNTQFSQKAQSMHSKLTTQTLPVVSKLVINKTDPVVRVSKPGPTLAIAKTDSALSIAKKDPTSLNANNNRNDRDADDEDDDDDDVNDEMPPLEDARDNIERFFPKVVLTAPPRSNKVEDFSPDKNVKASTSVSRDEVSEIDKSAMRPKSDASDLEFSLYVRGFPADTTEDELLQVFQIFGADKVDIKYKLSTESNVGLPFAFARFSNWENGEDAWIAMDGCQFKGRRLHCEASKRTIAEEGAVIESIQCSKLKLNINSQERPLMRSEHPIERSGQSLMKSDQSPKRSETSCARSDQRLERVSAENRESRGFYRTQDEWNMPDKRSALRGDSRSPQNHLNTNHTIASPHASAYSNASNVSPVSRANTDVTSSISTRVTSSSSTGVTSSSKLTIDERFTKLDVLRQGKQDNCERLRGDSHERNGRNSNEKHREDSCERHSDHERNLTYNREKHGGESREKHRDVSYEKYIGNNGEKHKDGSLENHSSNKMRSNALNSNKGSSNALNSNTLSSNTNNDNTTTSTMSSNALSSNARTSNMTSGNATMSSNTTMSSNVSNTMSMLFLDLVLRDCFDLNLRSLFAFDELPDDIFVVHVTFVVNDGRFWAWPLSQSTTKVVTEGVALLKKFNASPKKNLTARRRRCMAHYDSVWCRAWVNMDDISPHKTVEVFFVDYGNTAQVERDELKENDEEVWKCRPLATPFILRHPLDPGVLKAMENCKIGVKKTGSAVGYMIEVELVDLPASR